MGQTLDFDITEVFVLRAKKGSELHPPFWHVFIHLWVGVDLLTCLDWVSPNLSLGFLCLPGRVVGGLGQGEGKGGVPRASVYSMYLMG